MSSLFRKVNIGLVTPPAWFEAAIQEFPALVREDIGIQQMPVPIAEFGYRPGDFADAEAYVGEAARILAACECDVIGQVGTPFGWDHCPDEEAARARAGRLCRTAGVPVLTTVLAVLDAARSAGARRMVVAVPYYDPPVRDLWSEFLGVCGFEVVFAANLVDLGMEQDSNDYRIDFSYSLTDELLTTFITRCAAAAGGGDAVIVAGSACHTMRIAAELERVTGLSVIGADAALYRALMTHCDLTPAADYGSLFTGFQRD